MLAIFILNPNILRINYFQVSFLYKHVILEVYMHRKLIILGWLIVCVQLCQNISHTWIHGMIFAQVTIIIPGQDLGMYLLVPATRFSHVPRGLVLVVRCQERCDLVIAEKVVEPRPYWQVVDGLRSTLLSICPRQPAVGAAGRTALTVRMLVVRQLGMLAVYESDAVVGACFDLDHATFAHFLEEALRQGP